MAEIQKHKFWHYGSGDGVRCEYCGVERRCLPMPIGFRWVFAGEVLVKKPKCIKRFVKDKYW